MIGVDDCTRAAAVRFTPQIWIMAGGKIQEIRSVEEAARFLAKWPLSERGPLYYLAENSAQEAKLGSIPADEARRDFWQFCEEAGILAEATPLD